MPGVAAIRQDKAALVSSTTAETTALQKRQNPDQALNANNVEMNPPKLGSATVAFVGAPAAAGAAAAAPAVTLINKGPPGPVVLPLRKEHALTAVLPPTSSNAVIQTSSLSTTVSSSSCNFISSSSTGKGGPTVTLVRPLIHRAGPAAASVAAATQKGSKIVINSTTNVQSLPATAAASVATVGSGVSLQSSLVNNQPGSSMPATATVPVIKSECPKMIVHAVSQQHALTTSGQSTTEGNTIIEQTTKCGIPNPNGIPPSPPPASGTPTEMPKDSTNTVAQSLPRTSAASTGGIPALHLLAPAQNPANIKNVKLPPGMVLIRCENGQLLMLTQEALAQIQAKTQSKPQNTMASCPATPIGAPPAQLSTVRAPETRIIAQQVTPTTTIKQVSQAQKTVQPKPLQPAPLQHSAAVQPQIVVGGSAQTSTLGTAATAQPQTPQMAVQGATTISAVDTETMENGKKCKNFLSALIKLASSGNQSTEVAAKVKALVQNLLDGKIEVEDFTTRLYRELNSSPQSYLLPFLKKSLPALRQLIPDSAAFIQQSQQQQPRTETTTVLTGTTLSSSGQLTAGKTTTTVTDALQPLAIMQTQPAPVSVSNAGQPTPLHMLQPWIPGVLRKPPQIKLTQTPKAALGQPHNRLQLTTQQIQLNQLKTIPVVKPPVLPGTKVLPIVSAKATAAQNNKLEEPGSGSFGNNDDINDVTFMAGVNLSEESARILAANSELVGTLTRSCQDETFLLSAPLQRKILEIAKKHNITELHPDVVSYVSCATQQRLQNLIEKVSVIAQQKCISYKDDERYEQVSDVRGQLKFFGQLDQIEKRRKDEQEREILMRAAKSRSTSEDPKQLRLKQKAKEMQQQELAQKRQRDANLAALEAIGPRRKKKVDSLEFAGTEGSRKSTAVLDSSGVRTTRQFKTQRITRVNLRDLIFCLENERESRHSLLLYKAFLK